MYKGDTMRNINMYNMSKWYKMLSGKSILHVNQGMGKIYSKGQIKGYYNDLTEKVLKDQNTFSSYIPKYELPTGEKIFFPITVFQYGLGAYDLYLLEKKAIFLHKFKLMAVWALDNQEENGGWNTFFFIHPEAPYSAMAQGEGASLLIRAYNEIGEEKYLLAAKKAIDFMLISIDDGGTTLYEEKEVIFQECTHLPTILNGWIFALFGLYDYVLISNDSKAKEVLDRTVLSLQSRLVEFDNGYWSMYDTEGMITSFFYHSLHIAQLNVLYDLFEIETYKEYSDRWVGYQDNWFNRKRAFAIKVIQKLTEK